MPRALKVPFATFIARNTGDGSGVVNLVRSVVEACDGEDPQSTKDTIDMMVAEFRALIEGAQADGTWRMGVVVHM